MTPITLDFETYWSAKHQISKMTNIEYVMHPETEIISCAIKRVEKPTKVLFGYDDIAREFNDIERTLGWSNVIAVAHNMSEFDALILSWLFGITPRMWACTLSMARPWHWESGLSLRKLVQLYGIGVKDDTALRLTMGKHLKDFTPQEIEAMAMYNCADTDQCFSLFRQLLPKTSPDEMKLIDITIRMLVAPQFVADRELLTKSLAQVRANHEVLLLSIADIVCVDACATSAVADVKSKLRSATTFTHVLMSLGVPIPVKRSKTTGKSIPALAKTDEAFVALLEHADERVRAVTEARLNAKSTLLESRLATTTRIAATMNGAMPVPLRYSGATTTGRWSGSQWNPQNLPRVDKRAPRLSDALRKSLCAPPGHVVIVADLSAIELRVNHTLWKEPDSMARFDRGDADLYKAFAARLYSKNEADVTPDERQMGKVAQLGLGFGASAATFRSIALSLGDIDIPDDASEHVVHSWRGTYTNIVAGWRRCGQALRMMYNNHAMEVDPWGMVTTVAHGLRLPSGRHIRYPALRWIEFADGTHKLVYGGARYSTIYSSKVDENIVQALSRDIFAGHVLKFVDATGYGPALLCHDELVAIVPEGRADATLTILSEIMREPPSWWPELKLNAENGVGLTYGDAK